MDRKTVLATIAEQARSSDETWRIAWAENGANVSDTVACKET